MKIINSLSMSVMALSLALVGCVDDKYDFSDIDTTARISVSDLVIPVNIDKIELSSIIDINLDDPKGHIKLVDNGYAYVQDGDFTTGNISVPKVTINSVKSSSIDLNIPLNLPPVTITGIKLDPIPVKIPEAGTEYSFNAANISKDICDLNVVRGDLDVDVKINISGVDGLASSYDLKDFTLRLPDGLMISEVTGAVYDKANNSLVVNSSISTPRLNVKCHVSGMNIPAGAFTESTHSLSMSGQVGITDGTIVINPRNDLDLSGVKGLALKVEYSFSQMTVKSVDGVIMYTIDDVNVPDINITDLPDVLSQPGTNLILANPCLYLSINNPLSIVGAYAQTGFSITSYHGDASAVYSIDNSYFTIAANAVDNFCFSPKMPAKPDAAFADCLHVPFTSLSNVLSGDGLPDKLKVDLPNPNIPRQTIKEFLLDHDYGKVHGDYKFVAPLQFNKGTEITYSDVVDGWSSDDLDKVTVQRLDVNLNISTDVPIAIDFTGYPLDKNGKRINNVSIQGAKINANAQNQEVKISISGEISGLDGIEFTAKASADGSSAALSPNMHITLSNVRPCVSGYYQDEL